MYIYIYTDFFGAMESLNRYHSQQPGTTKFGNEEDAFYSGERVREYSARPDQVGKKYVRIADIDGGIWLQHTKEDFVSFWCSTEALQL